MPLPRKLTVLFTLTVSAAVALGCLTWWFQTGCFSAVNYDRVSTGMGLEDVRALLGSEGDEVSLSEVPGVRPADKLPGSPDGWLGVVWGERCFRWKEGHRQILVGLSGDKVVSKYLLDYGL